MSDRSAIQWTDATWNPTTGCRKVSPGCAHCYITRTPAFRIAGRKFVNGETDVRLHPDRLEQPLHWKKPRRVFVNSLSDLFHISIPRSFIDKVFAVMALCPQHTFQVLTKRPERMLAYFTEGKVRWRVSGRAFGYNRYSEIAHDIAKGDWWPLPNVWLGVSVENQHFVDKRIPLLLKTPAAVRFISAEPLLGPIDLDPFLDAGHETNGPAGWESTPSLDWVIVGGESGPGARPFETEWGWSIVKQCRNVGVPCFVKQLGTNPIARTCDPAIGFRLELHDKMGGDMSEWPSGLQVRQYPERWAR